jgi:outer membrane protein insertion porin family
MHIPRAAISTVVGLVTYGLTQVDRGNVRSLAAEQHLNQINFKSSGQQRISPIASAPVTLAQVTHQTVVSREPSYTLPSEIQHQAVYDAEFIQPDDRINPAFTPPSIGSEPIPESNTEQIVRSVEIRFVNNLGEAADKDGNPIQGRLSREYITSELKLKPGDAFTEEVVRGDLQQLQQLGLFERVDVSVVPTDDGVDVIYNIQERPARSLNFGGGINDDVGIYGTLGYRDLTVGRTHQRVQGNVQVGLENIEFDAQFVSPYQVTQPNSLGYGFRAYRDRSVSNIFNRDIDLPNDDGRVRERRFGGSATFTRPVGQWWGTMGLNFTRISTRDREGNLFREDERGNPLSFSGTGIDDLYTVSLGVTRDWRDNPFNPTRGALLKLSTEQSIPIGVGNIVQNRLVGNYIQYVPVRWLSSEAENNQRDAFPEMFAFNIQAGTVLGDLPPTQAFRLGGINSVRGYEDGDVGSGRTYVLASGEYRFPIVSRVGGVIFADFASDLGSGDTVPGEPAIVRNKPGTGFGTGVGARWRSPFGILRVDLGVNDQGEVRFYTEFGTGDRF